MSERYKKIKEIGSDMWVMGCPIIMYKGVLLHDNKTNNNLLQLGFCSIVEKEIVAIEIKYKGYSFADELITEGEYSYLDLKARINDKIGVKSPIYLDDNNARRFQITITRVFFSDKSHWENQKELVEMEKQEKLLGKLKDVYEQFKREYNRPELGDDLYVPQIQNEYWRCICGALNIHSDVCRVCKLSRNNFHVLLNLQTLKKNKEDYEEEKKVKEEKQREADENERIEIAKNKRKIVILFSVGIVAILLALCLNEYVFEPYRHKKLAESYLTKREYEAADKEYEIAYDSLDADPVQDKYSNLCINYLQENDVENAEICYEHLNEDRQSNDNELNLKWRDACIDYINSVEENEKLMIECYNHIKKQDIINSSELNMALLEKGRQYLLESRYNKANEILFSRVSDEYAEQLEAIYYECSKTQIENGECAEVVEGCFNSLSEQHKMDLSDALKENYLLLVSDIFKIDMNETDNQYNIGDGLQEYYTIQPYLTSQQIEEIKKKLYELSKKSLNINGWNAYAKYGFAITSDYKDSKTYIKLLNIISDSDLTNQYNKLSKMNVPFAKKYIQKNEKMKKYREVCGKWKSNDNEYLVYVDISMKSGIHIVEYANEDRFLYKKGEKISEESYHIKNDDGLRYLYYLYWEKIVFTSSGTLEFWSEGSLKYTCSRR